MDWHSEYWRPIGLIARRALVEAMRLLYERGVINLRGGNASVRVTIAPGFEVVYITPSSVAKHSLREEDIAAISLDGSVLDGRPSVEAPMHLEVYSMHESVRAVVHAHSPYTLVANKSGLLGEILDQSIEAKYYVGCIKRVGVMEPGSSELARAVAERLDKCKVVVLEDHGVVSVGVSSNIVNALYQAIDRIIALEDIAKIALFGNYSALARKKPPLLEG